MSSPCQTAAPLHFVSVVWDRFRLFGALMGLVVALTGLFAESVQAAEPAQRLNVLFIFTDDQRADTIGALGNRRIRTPNIDRLVRSGTTLTRAYCQGSRHGAVCVPSRGMLMTGRPFFRLRDDLQGEITWPQKFGEAGYRTFITGKWHNGEKSLLRSFQEGRAIFPGGMGDPYQLPVVDVRADSSLTTKRNSEKHSGELFTDTAVEFLREQTDVRPFVCYVAFNLPHDPRTAPPEFARRYLRKPPPLPGNFLAAHPFNNGELSVRDEALLPWPRDPQALRKELGDYYACIEFVDAQIGRILEALRASGLFERTLIVFASDHGLALGSHGLLGKQNLYEHSMRAPLIFAGPGIPRGRRSDALCYLLDICPTLYELAGVPMPERVEGRSLAGILRGHGGKVRDSIFTSYGSVQRAVCDDRWKLIVYPAINRTQLFDLRRDPHELQDLASRPKHAHQLARLTERLRQAQREFGDELPLSSSKPVTPDVNIHELNAKRTPKRP